VHGQPQALPAGALQERHQVRALLAAGAGDEEEVVVAVGGHGRWSGLYSRSLVFWFGGGLCMYGACTAPAQCFKSRGGWFGLELSLSGVPLYRADELSTVGDFKVPTIRQLQDPCIVGMLVIFNQLQGGVDSDVTGPGSGPPAPVKVGVKTVARSNAVRRCLWEFRVGDYRGLLCPLDRRF